MSSGGNPGTGTAARNRGLALRARTPRRKRARRCERASYEVDPSGDGLFLSKESVDMTKDAAAVAELRKLTSAARKESGSLLGRMRSATQSTCERSRWRESPCRLLTVRYTSIDSEQLIALAHVHGIGVFGATLPPFEGGM